MIRNLNQSNDQNLKQQCKLPTSITDKYVVHSFVELLKPNHKSLGHNNTYMLHVYIPATDRSVTHWLSSNGHPLCGHPISFDPSCLKILIKEVNSCSDFIIKIQNGAMYNNAQDSKL